MSKLIQEAEMYKRKLARARRIARYRRRKNIDLYIKKRVYMIMGVFLVFIILMFIFAVQANKVVRGRDAIIERQEENFKYVDVLLKNLSEDSLVIMLGEMTKAIDSLQIMIFVYHRRFMRDQKDIQIYRDQARNYRKRFNKLMFPKYLGVDSLKYNFRNVEDSIEVDEYDEDYDSVQYVIDPTPQK